MTNIFISFFLRVDHVLLGAFHFQLCEQNLKITHWDCNMKMMLFLFGSEGLINVKSALRIVVFLDYEDVLLNAFWPDYLYLMSDLPPLLSSCFLFACCIFCLFPLSFLNWGPWGCKESDRTETEQQQFRSVSTQN